MRINSTLSFKNHLTEKSSSAQSLINLTWKNVFSNKRIALSAKHKIFDSVVKSTLCYASQVWGADEYEEMELFQKKFLKKLFNLPQNTPNYCIYLETGLPKLLTNTLKSQADFIIKLCSHYEDSRLSKKLFLYELRNKDWWYKKWQTISNACDENFIIDTNNLGNLKENLYNIIQKNDDATRDMFILKARESNSRVLYSQLNFNLQQRNYFHDSLRYDEISIIFKARCEVLNLNGNPYNGSFHQFCSLCNLNSKEDCYHIIGIRPIFRPQRVMYFGKPTLTLQESVQLLNECEWKTLSNFLKSVCNYRKLLISKYV